MAKPKTAPVIEPEVTEPEEETAPVIEPEVTDAFVKIRMKTTSASPDVSLNWQEGQICTVSAEEAKNKVDSGLASYIKEAA